MEAVKGVIFGRDKIEQGYKYLVGFVLITDEPLDLVSLRGETVVMGGSPVNMLTPALQTLTKFKPPHAMGEIGGAILEVANYYKPDTLEKVVPIATPAVRKQLAKVLDRNDGALRKKAEKVRKTLKGIKNNER